MLHTILFLIFAGICVAGALNFLLQRHPVNSALSLIVVMGSLALLFLLLGAEFVAAVQIIVYAGAVMVLFVFVIMLLNAGEEERTRGSRVALFLGVPGLVALFGLLCWTLSASRFQLGQVQIGGYYVPTQELGIALFREFLLPFEITSVLVLIASVINGIFGKRFPRNLVATVALFFPGATFAYAVWVVSQFAGLSQAQIPHIERLFSWIEAGGFRVDYGFYLDQLSITMLLIVTGVGFLIHIYSVGYMAEEGGYYRFFSYLNLFMFFMLMLILAHSYLLMFVGWEGVGLASYLLIGFFFLKQSAAQAGKKAFITNRIGDYGFLLGMFLLIKHFGTLDYDKVFKAVSGVPVETGT